MKRIWIVILCCLQLSAFAQYNNIKKWAETELLNSAALRQAHTGICIYEPASGKYWYRYQDNRYFTPASNAKIFTLYTGLRYLGDSLPGLRYLNTDSVLYVKGTGDPSFLHPDYTYQPAFQLLQQTAKKIQVVPVSNENKRFGPGWAWNDYQDYYQPELNEWPVYGNVARIRHHGDSNLITPHAFELSWKSDDTLKELVTEREEHKNLFYLSFNSRDKSVQEAEVPFITGTPQDLAARLQDTLHKTITVTHNNPTGYTILNSIPVDSLFSPMMHRSDNFFAEQTLMMCSARLWDTISSSRMIDYMRSTYLSQLPDTPRWVDGSGLSRYNLFTPRDFVTVLTDMYKTYDTERLYSIFPTGGKGTLKNYYKQQFVHAKTGTLSGCVALSGYLITRKKKTLVFSVLVNNHNNSAGNVRRSVESFLTQIYEQY
jgi:D-alanyl-D-alanine carboxypeptidase/D-alanyl-D-alanine-endopeptidase (penicillin-binding protein 4)